MSFLSYPIWKLRLLIEKGEISPKELLTSYLERIEKLDPKICAYVTVCEDEAKHMLNDSNPNSRLFGIPLAIKDVICTKGIRTTCSSKILSNFFPPYDATVIRKLKENGAIIIGKTNMDEFAMGSSTEHSAFKITRNPFDKTRVPGGSSGGSAAAVAASLCAGSLGSDTGGSIRLPASFCGIVGLKPTYGRVSRFGLVAFASSLDQIGPMTRDVKDCALLLEIIGGFDPLDSTSKKISCPPYTKLLEGDLKGLKFGVPKEYFLEGIDSDVLDNVNHTKDILKDLGMKEVPISLPHTEYAVSCYYIIAPAEASSNLSRYDGVKYGFREESSDLLMMYRRTRSTGFGQEVKRRIMLGTFVLSSGYYDAYYKKASQVRTLIKEDFEKAFKKCDFIITPTAPTPAFKIGERLDDPLKMYLTDIFTIPANLAGLPAISLPCGLSRENLPLGLQIIGRPFDEETILSVSYRLEENLPFPKDLYNKLA